MTLAGKLLRARHDRALPVLIRQRDAIASVGVWYLAPFAPGMTLLLLGRWFQSHATHRSLGTDHLIIALVAVLAIAGLVIFGPAVSSLLSKLGGSV